MIGKWLKITSAFLLFVMTLGLGLGTIFAQDNDVLDVVDSCGAVSWSIDGPGHILVNKTYGYSVSGTTLGLLDLDREETLVDWSADDTSLVYDLYANNELLFSTDDTNFYYEFTDPGLYYLYATLSVEDCSYRILQELVVYDVMYALFIDHDLTEKDINVQQTLANDNIGLIPLMIYGDIDSQKPDWAKTFIDRDSLLELSDVSGMFASPDNYSSFFDALSQADATGSALDSIPLMLLSDVDKVIVRKWLAPFVKERNDQPLYLLNKQDFEQVLFDLVANKGLESESLNDYSLTFDDDWSSLLGTPGRVIDSLIYHGFPIDVISILLSLTLGILLIVVCRQIVGLPVFGVYYPLLFALSFHLLGLKTAVGLFLVAGLALWIHGKIIKRIMILSAAKTGLGLVLYIVFSLVAWRVYQELWLTVNGFVTVDQSLFLFAYIGIYMVAERVFVKGSLLSYQGILQIVYFFVVSWLTYLLFHSGAIQNFFLTYPLTVVGVLILILLIGQYSGLQLGEVIRFRTLLRKQRKKRIK